MTWTDERVETLKELWESCQVSASQIAQKLGRDVTRNAVLAKVQRLGLTGGTLNAPRGERKNKAPPAPKKPRKSCHGKSRTQLQLQARRRRPPQVVIAPEIWEPKPEQAIISLIDIQQDMCRWPYGDPKAAGFGFCGRRTVPGSSFCTEHHGQVFKAGKKRAGMGLNGRRQPRGPVHKRK